MTTTFKTFCVRPNGRIVALFSDGRIAEQVSKANNRSGHYDADWKTVTAEGLAGRIVQLAARYDGRLIALTAPGDLYELDPPELGSAAAPTWRPVEPPAEG